MEHHNRRHGQSEEFEQRPERDEYASSPRTSFVRRNRKKILLGIIVIVLVVLIIIVLIAYLLFAAIASNAGKVLNQQTINQAQKIASDSAKLLPPDLQNNSFLQNFTWIINIINTFKSLEGGG